MQMENGIMNITQKDRELLFKDLSARLPYHVRVKVWLKDGTTEEGVLDLEHNYADVLRDAFYYNKIVDIKPYLRSLSNITEEERQILEEYDEYVEPYSIQLKIDFYNKYHFDYRGLIEKDLAIEDTKENNPHNYGTK